MSDSLEQEKSNEDNSQTDTAESRAKRRKGRMIKLNIIFGVIMFGSVIGTMLKGGSISSDNIDILEGVLIIGIVTSVAGIFITNAVYKVINLLSDLKSAVKNIKNGSRW